MATIRYRPNAESYQVQIRRKGFPALSRSFPTKALAVEWATKTELELVRRSSGLPEKMVPITFGEALDTYLRILRPHDQRDHSLAKRLRPELGAYNLGHITPRILTDLLNKLGDSGLANQTVKHYLGLVSRVYSSAIKRFHTFNGENPVRRIVLPSVANTGRGVVVAPFDIERLTAGLSDPLNAFIRLAYETGMRRGEIERIRPEHVDPIMRTLAIPITKTGKPRTIPLSPNGVVWAGTVALNPVSGDVVSRVFKSRCRSKLGRSDIRFHDLRHSAVTRFFTEHGLNPMEVSAISGHTTLAMLKRYTHLDPRDLGARIYGAD